VRPCLSIELLIICGMLLQYVPACHCSGPVTKKAPDARVEEVVTEECSPVRGIRGPCDNPVGTTRGCGSGGDPDYATPKGQYYVWNGEELQGYNLPRALRSVWTSGKGATIVGSYGSVYQKH
jgi:hypothetical protein